MLFHQYKNIIKNLPNKAKYDKSDLFIQDLLVKQDNKMEVYYSPHNEWVNRKASILILGITPGWSQMEMAIRKAKHYLDMEYENGEIIRNVKRECRFFGSVRKNLIMMLNELGLHEYLKMSSCHELFSERDGFLHTCSLIKFPLFINQKNYNGHNPPILKNKFIMEQCNLTMQSDIVPLNRPLIIPLGKAVESVIEFWVSAGSLKIEQCLFGFPHPSGANGHRHEQFKNVKQQMERQIHDYFKAFDHLS